MLCMAVALLCTGCPDSWRPPEKAPGSALWIGTNSELLETSDLARLEEAGISEIYLTVARWEPDAPSGPLTPVEAPDPPASMPVTLAIDRKSVV